jgi:hypothetical protein
MRSQYTDQLIQRAERDDQFRAKLLTDPRAAASEELGVEIPDALDVKVIEEAPDEVILVLPAKSQPGALTDEALAEVTGGSSTYCAACNEGTAGAP